MAIEVSFEVYRTSPGNLESNFHCQQYIVGSQRFYLAHDLSVNERQVKVWFQNRRIKWRRQYLESSTASLRQAKIEQDADKEGCRKLDTSTWVLTGPVPTRSFFFQLNRFLRIIKSSEITFGLLSCFSFSHFNLQFFLLWNSSSSLCCILEGN